MKKIKTTFLGIILIIIFACNCAYAREGYCGYEGGISTGEMEGKTTMQYSELCFVTGEPIVFEGTLDIKKALKQDIINATYTYNLRNAEKEAALTRVITFEIRREEKSDGQVTEEVVFSRNPVETIRVGDASYVLDNYDFTRSRITDSKPAADYFAGSSWGRKTYRIGNGAPSGNVTVEVTGSSHGYEQYWCMNESSVYNYVIECERTNGDDMDRWGGAAQVKVSSSTVRQLEYVKNEAYQISFDGGYVQTQYNSSVLEYECHLPEFDSKGISTDYIRSLDGSLKLETFPAQSRLLVPDLKSVRGHWAENDIRLMFSLEVFDTAPDVFRPDQYMNRAEFTGAVLNAIKEIPKDPALVTRTSSRTTVSRTRGMEEEEVLSPFIDVSVGSRYFEAINSAYQKGIITGTGGDMFAPDRSLTVASALTIFVRALGLENLAPNPAPVTVFKDNDEIPGYAREAAYVAYSIGLINGDDKGYLRPNENLTKARAAALLKRFIEYMQDSNRY
jgi:N-acetylmuramoyl-L-alanine amidase